MTGTIKRRFDSPRSYGFIIADGGEELFFHRDNSPDYDALRDGDRVQFESIAGGKGPKAIDVVKLPA